jgi:hypothetical protein
MSQHGGMLASMEIQNEAFLVGGIPTNPSEKYESVGMMTFPTEWKVIVHSCSKAPTSNDYWFPFFTGINPQRIIQMAPIFSLRWE